MNRLSLVLRQVARRSALGLLAIVLLLIGTGFLTAAGWSAIRDSAGATAASLAMALVYCGGGLVVLLVMRLARPRRLPPAPIAPPVTPASLATTAIAAFFQGLGTGVAARRQGTKRPR
jgi:hypothetical protein